MANPHDTLLKKLTVSSRVRLIARLNDPDLVGNMNERYLHVFVPDLHLISKDQLPKYRYGFYWADEFSVLIKALLNTRRALRDKGHNMTVTQLGDFVDLWRQSGIDPRGVRPIVEDYPVIRDRFLRNAKDSLSARLILGNHDLEAGQSNYFRRAHMADYLPGTGYTLMATHGDAFDLVESFPQLFKALAVKTFGRLAPASTYPMDELKALRNEKMPKNQKVKIQGDATLEKTRDAVKSLPDRFNVIDVHKVNERKKKHSLLANAVKAADVLRTPGEIGKKGSIPKLEERFVPKLKAIVIAHTHHAQMIVDHTAKLVLMDCGAWIENYRVGKGPKRPNHQLGAVCGSDMRIYQLD